MKRLALLGMAAAIVAASVGLLWQLRQGGDDAAAQTAPPPAAAQPEAASPTPAAPATAERNAPAAPAPELGGERALPGPDGTDETTRLLASGVPQKLMTEAARCYRGEKGERFARLRLEHRFQIENGRARVSDVSVVSDELGLPRLSRCIVDRLEGFEWPEPTAPDLEERMETAISILDMQKRAGTPANQRSRRR